MGEGGGGHGWAEGGVGVCRGGYCVSVDKLRVYSCMHATVVYRVERESTPRFRR